MLSRVTIRRLTGDETKNDKGYTVPEWSSAPDVPFRLGGNRGAQTSRRTTVGGAEVETATRVGHFPVGTDLADDDYVEITDGECAGRVFRVIEAQAADQQTALRVPLIEVSRPEEW